MTKFGEQGGRYQPKQVDLPLHTLHYRHQFRGMVSFCRFFSYSGDAIHMHPITA